MWNIYYCTNFSCTKVSGKFVYRFTLLNNDGKNFYAKFVLSLNDIGSVAYFENSHQAIYIRLIAFTSFDAELLIQDSKKISLQVWMNNWRHLSKYIFISIENVNASKIPINLSKRTYLLAREKYALPLSVLSSIQKYAKIIPCLPWWSYCPEGKKIHFFDYEPLS